MIGPKVLCPQELFFNKVIYGVGFDKIYAFALISSVTTGSLPFRKFVTQPEGLYQVQCHVLKLSNPQNGESNTFNFLICHNLLE